MQQRHFFFNTGHEKATQLPIDHYEYCTTVARKCHTDPNEIEEARVETDFKMFNTKQ